MSTQMHTHMSANMSANMSTHMSTHMSIHTATECVGTDDVAAGWQRNAVDDAHSTVRHCPPESAQ